ncbi:MAG TPA: carbohydrate ABC transporter permease [Candidatus Limiplasma sp.]|nr:carbohydrate ABC transporter permease [Candidatus Limiplasma sp.]
MTVHLRKRYWGRTVFVFALLILFLVPFYLVLNNSFRSTELFVSSPFQLTDSLDLKNYVDAFTKMRFMNGLENSAMITLCSVAVILITASMSAHYLVRNHNRLTSAIFGVMVASMIVPFQAVMIPLAKIYGSMNLYNNPWTLIFFYMGFGQAFAVFIFHGFIKGIPVELEEAALIDGCGRLKNFFRIVLPNLKPVMVTVLILDVLWIWNDYLLPSMVLLSPDLRTLPLSTYSFFTTYSVDYAPLMAGLVLTIIPVITLYLLCQKQIIEGVVQGAIK